MIDPPPNWYLDPTNRHELRYWDGKRWTEHVSSAGVGGTDPVLTAPIAGIPARQPGSASDGTGARSGLTRFGSRHLGWAGLLLCVLAVFAVSVPGAAYARAESHGGVRLDGSTQHIVLPAHRTYGIYVDDADNSGYSEQCSAVDVNGRMVDMRDPSWSVSGSDTETLDIVFNTGSGTLTINCSVPGERVTARPVPNARPLLLGVVLAGILGCFGATMIIVWFVSRTPRQRRNVTAAAGQGVMRSRGT